MNPGRAMAEPLVCAVLGMRCLGPVFGVPVVCVPRISSVAVTSRVALFAVPP